MKSFKALLLLFSLCALRVGAQSMEELLVSMPETMTPYLTVNQKKEMVESMKLAVSTSVDNQLHGTSTLDTLTADYCCVTLSSAHQLQILRLPLAGGIDADCGSVNAEGSGTSANCGGDSIVCVVDIYSAPGAVSKLSFYTLGWRAIGEGFGPELAGLALDERMGLGRELTPDEREGRGPELTPDEREGLGREFTLDELCHRPDGMSVSQFDSLRTWLDPLLVALRYDPLERCLVASLTLPYSPTDEREKLEAILCERKLRWNGISFEKCY